MTHPNIKEKIEALLPLAVSETPDGRFITLPKYNYDKIVSALRASVGLEEALRDFYRLAGDHVSLAYSKAAKKALAAFTAEVEGATK